MWDTKRTFRSNYTSAGQKGIAKSHITAGMLLDGSLCSTDAQTVIRRKPHHKSQCLKSAKQHLEISPFGNKCCGGAVNRIKLPVL